MFSVFFLIFKAQIEESTFLWSVPEKVQNVNRSLETFRALTRVAPCLGESKRHWEAAFPGKPVLEITPDPGKAPRWSPSCSACLAHNKDVKTRFLLLVEMDIFGVE